MNKFRNNINFHLCVVGVLVPIVCIILIRISYALKQVNPMFTVLTNMETFAAFLLIFLSGICVSFVTGAQIKNGILNGALIGFFGESMVLVIMTVSALLLASNFQINQLTNGSFMTYVIFNLIFMAFTGAIGGLVGSIINKIGISNN